MKKVIEGRISSPFGRRIDPINKIETIHQGVDISAPVGTPIFSPVAGRIAAIYKHSQGGLTVIIASGCGGLRFGFCHLSSADLSTGANVCRGQMFARSGNSGRSTGAHLHYSVKCGGRWQGDLYVGGLFVDSSKYLDIL